MRVEQEQSDLGRIEIGCLRNRRERWRLIGGCANLRGRHHMASLAPSLGKPSTIGGIGSKCRGGRHNRTNYQVLRKAAELCVSIHWAQSPRVGARARFTSEQVVE